MTNGNKRLVRAGQYPVLSLFDELNRFFDDTRPTASRTSLGKFAPHLDLTENDTEYLIKGDLPGLQVSDVNIELRDNTLVISGERRDESERKEGEVTYYERSFGSFSRTVPFSVEIDEDNASAEMKNGVLSIRVPKSAKEVKGSKKLSIKTS
jgi:HSP20 family protein